MQFMYLTFELNCKSDFMHGGGEVVSFHCSFITLVAVTAANEDADHHSGMHQPCRDQPLPCRQCVFAYAQTRLWLHLGLSALCVCPCLLQLVLPLTVYTAGAHLLASLRLHLTDLSACETALMLKDEP